MVFGVPLLVFRMQLTKEPIEPWTALLVKNEMVLEWAQDSSMSSNKCAFWKERCPAGVNYNKMSYGSAEVSLFMSVPVGNVWYGNNLTSTLCPVTH